MNKVFVVTFVLVLSSLACMQQVPASTSVHNVTTTPPASPTVAVATIPSIAPDPTPAPDPKYTVVASKLYVRDNALDVVSHLDYGDVVSCHLLPSGWCLIYRDQMVWSGCLNPNPMQLECKAR